VNEPAITFYENHRLEDNNEILTAVWEMDGVDHRLVLSHPIFLREIAHEFSFQHRKMVKLEQEIMKESMKSAYTFSPKHTRIPQRDEDCSWDYYKAQCHWPNFCEYRYRFGDMLLDHSCRLKSMTGESYDSIFEKIAEKMMNKDECQCKSECISGFCQYESDCAGAIQPFGEQGGYWGECRNDEQLVVVQDQEREHEPSWRVVEYSKMSPTVYITPLSGMCEREDFLVED